MLCSSRSPKASQGQGQIRISDSSQFPTARCSVFSKAYLGGLAASSTLAAVPAAVAGSCVGGRARAASWPPLPLVPAPPRYSYRSQSCFVLLIQLYAAAEGFACRKAALPPAITCHTAAQPTGNCVSSGGACRRGASGRPPAGLASLRRRRRRRRRYAPPAPATTPPPAPSQRSPVLADVATAPAAGCTPCAGSGTAWCCSRLARSFWCYGHLLPACPTDCGRPGWWATRRCAWASSRGGPTRGASTAPGWCRCCA